MNETGFGGRQSAFGCLVAAATLAGCATGSKVVVLSPVELATQTQAEMQRVTPHVTEADLNLCLKNVQGSNFSLAALAPITGRPRPSVRHSCWVQGQTRGGARMIFDRDIDVAVYVVPVETVKAGPVPLFGAGGHFCVFGWKNGDKSATLVRWGSEMTAVKGDRCLQL